MQEWIQVPARARRMYPRGGFAVGDQNLDTTSIQVLLAIVVAGPAGSSATALAEELALDISSISHAAKALRGLSLIEFADASGTSKPLRATAAGTSVGEDFVAFASASER